ncbi:MAG: YqaA family protein [Phycisphaeraceae bacterium]|nr:YqaA family protein [Phycisphaeraceae bacterium]
MADESSPPTDVVTDEAEHIGAAATTGPVARWAIHRHLYDWVLSLAHTRHATWSLFAISFAESSVFPIPPDVLLAPMCMSHRRRALWFATVTTVASILGALLGYAIGWGAWETTQGFFFNWVPGFTPDKFDTVQAWYDHWGVWVLLIAAFTPIPFKVFTIAGGVFGQMLIPFLLASLVGRAGRFYLVAAAFWWIGPKAAPLIDRYFNWLCLLFVLLLVGGFVLLKFLH